MTEDGPSESPDTGDGPTTGPLLGSLKSNFASSKYSDLTIRCGDQEFRVHKLVVCGQSSFFAKMIDGDWKEAAEGIVTLSEDDPRIVEAMLYFLYNFEYNSSGFSSGEDDGVIPPMLFDVYVYSIADKYDIPHLKETARKKFEQGFQVSWDPDSEANGFETVVAEVYASTPSTDRGLRDIVVGTAKEHLAVLVENQAFVAMLEDTAAFAADVAKSFVAVASCNSYKTWVRYRCPECDAEWASKDGPLNGDDYIEYYCFKCGNGWSGNHWSCTIIE